MLQAAVDPGRGCAAAQLLNNVMSQHQCSSVLPYFRFWRVVVHRHHHD